jgi:hypothetical protein
VIDAIAARIKLRPWTDEQLHGLWCPEMKMLPFVAMPENAKANDKAINYWCDEPTKHGHVDHKRGRGSMRSSQ